MRIIFRYDDFSASEAVSLQTDRTVFDLFREHRIPVVVGATPYMAQAVHDPANTIFHRLDLDTTRIRLLQEALEHGWQLALHGFTHRRSRVRISEFACEPKQAQMAKIENGVRALRSCFPGVPIEVFAPPWDSFDATTVECLAAQGFRVLCGSSATGRSMGPECSAAFQAAREFCFVPSLLETRGLVDYLTSYPIQDLERVLGNAWLGVTMHGYDFDGSRPHCHVSRKEMAEVLARIQEARVEVGTIPTSANPVILGLRQESILKGKILLSRPRLVRPFLPASRCPTSARALTRVGDCIAVLAWQLKTRFHTS